MEELEEMAERCPTGAPNLVCDTHVIGQSCEGRDLKMLRVTMYYQLQCVEVKYNCITEITIVWHNQ